LAANDISPIAVVGFGDKWQPQMRVDCCDRSCVIASLDEVGVFSICNAQGASFPAGRAKVQE